MEQTQFWLPQGTLVGNRYTLETVLGKGGYGITYRGMDTRLQQPVAIKEYFPVFWCSRFADKTRTVHVQQGMEAQYCKGLDRFLDEARTLAQLSGIAGVVRVTDFFEENATAYLVMEYLDGKNLKQMLDGFGGRIPPQVLLPVLSPAMFSLQKVHERGLIHRDLSPDNIMMLSDGSVRIIDFGNARDTTDNKSMTLAMKQGFAAPEQYRSKGQGPYTDVYGICATIYYCLTGKLPPQAMERLMGAPLPKPSELGVQIPAWQEDVILQGLELYVNQRIPTMEALWQRLYRDHEIEVFPDPPVEQEPAPVKEEPVPQPPQEEPPVIPEQSSASAEVPEPTEVVQEASPEPEEAAQPENLPEPPPVLTAREPEPWEEHHEMEGMTVPLIRYLEPEFEQPQPTVAELPANMEPEVTVRLEPEVIIRQEPGAQQRPERYFVPPKPVNPPQYPQEPERRESLVERMQNVCARIFGRSR